MPFSDFQGYERVTRVFSKIVAAQRFHSSYLFVGPPQVGKRKMARAFAMAIFCHEVEGDYCGECSRCRRILHDRFPDFQIIEPDGAYIRIEQAREMMAEAAMQPFEAERRVFVLDPVDRMRPEAANSLLKVLEEPFDFAHFILITSNPKAILPTIESRCQKIRFSALPYDLVALQLQKQFELSPEEAATLARISGGKPGLAEQLAQEEFLAERDAIVESLACVAQGGEVEALRIAGEFRGNQQSAVKYLELLIPVLRDAALLSEGGSAVFNLDRSERIREATGNIPSSNLVAAWQDATECTGNISRMANVQSQLERVLLNLCPQEEPARR